MKRFFLVLWGIIAFIPLAYGATTPLNLTPPNTDVSVIFLGDIFGIVDGVLHGTGSQIMGQMFNIFNSAVLSLGGIVLLYTLMVSTLNTAHEGEFLGRQWSSIWIPLRSTFGLALLLPKASGYCMMQIFVMWVVVQGVGAADKIWDAALTYLKEGGTIVRQPRAVSSSNTTTDAKPLAASEYLVQATACMYGVQSILTTQVETNLAQASKGEGPCNNNTSAWYCTYPPDFVNSVSPTTVGQTATTCGQVVSVSLPNFASGSSSGYDIFNGVCGTLSWIPIVNTTSDSCPTTSTSDTSSLDTSTTSSAVDIMYTDAATASESIIDNCFTTGASDTGDCLNTNGNLTTDSSTSPWMPLGYPEKDSSGTYTLWQTSTADSNAGKSALLTGDELLYAVSDYYGIMENLTDEIALAISADAQSGATSFVETASEKGWIMAGAWFWKLATLNNQNSSIAFTNIAEVTAAMPTSIGSLSNAFTNKICPHVLTASGSNDDCSKLNSYSSLSSSAIKNLSTLYTLITQSITKATPISDYTANSIPGYNYNAGTTMQLASSGANITTFKTVSFDYTFDLGTLSFKSVPSLWTDAGAWISGSLWNAFAGVMNVLISVMNLAANRILFYVFTTAFVFILPIFEQGVATLSASSNPIVAIASMGNELINEVVTITLDLAVLLGAAGFFAPGAVIVISMIILPFVFAILGITFTSGVMYAYYIPMLPYLFFTFGGLAWMMSVIEAMIAAPIVALGVTHPEGNQAFGKADQAIMLLLNVFLRPSLMILGYVAAIILSYVGIWLLNAGFDTAIGGTFNYYTNSAYNFGILFMMLIYTGAYVGMAQKAFDFGINKLPDGILKWLGSGVSSLGSEVAGEISRDVKQQGQQHGQAMHKALSGIKGPSVPKKTSSRWGKSHHP